MGGNFLHRLGVFNQITAGPTTDVVFAAQTFATGTSTGSQTFSSSDLTGYTPKAALILAPHRPVGDEPGESVTCGIGMGLVGSSFDYSFDAASEDGVATTDVRREYDSGSGYRAPRADTATAKVAAASVVSGGVALNFSVNSVSSYRGSYLAFAGADTSARGNFTSLGTGTSALDQTSPGFQPDVVIMLGQCGGGANEGLFGLSFGICAYEAGAYNQRSVLWAETDGAADGAPFQTLRSDAAGGQVSSNNGSLTYKLTVNDFDASGFSITPSASGGSDVILWLALKFAGRQHKLVDFTTPTSAGSSTIGGAGFTPRLAILVLTNLEALDDHPGATADNQSGFSLCFITSTSQWSTSWRINSGSATTDTATYSEAVAILGASATSCAAISATFTAWTSDGVTVNYSAVQGTGKKGFVLFVE